MHLTSGVQRLIGYGVGELTVTRAEGAKGGSKESTPPRGRQSQPGGIDSELAEVRWHYQGENEGGGKGGRGENSPHGGAARASQPAAKFPLA